MARPCKCRWIGTDFEVTAFKPCGVPGRTLDVVELQLDELEAVRLADLEGLYQEAAAGRMGVSRPTFGRLIESARHKIASALLGSKMLVFKGGAVMARDMRTFSCADCGASFQVAYGAQRPAECPSCRGKNFCRAEGERGGRWRGRGAGRGRCCRNRHRARAARRAEGAMEQKESAE
jgi:predicted DNA-binding protein (UPF0251 family)/DNA-directed RNA polymerase subunit RPC12/RpoP